jgi:transposase InsO family protein
MKMCVSDWLEKIFLIEGQPERLHCYNGKEFMGEVQQLCQRNIQIIHGRPYHPQTQGRVERVNQTLKTKLMKLFFSPKKW